MEAVAEPEVDVVDSIAVARLYGEPLFDLPQDLYIPPDALEVFLEAFEGPLDLLLYLIRQPELQHPRHPDGERDAPVPRPTSSRSGSATSSSPPTTC